MQPFPALLISVLFAMPTRSALAKPGEDAALVPLDAAAFSGLPAHRAVMSAHGQALDCTGVSLTELLQKTGAMATTPLRGKQLTSVVDVQAADGYRVVFSLGELEAGLGKTEVILASQCQGKPLDAHDGPLRLIVPSDSRPARSVRQVNRITVRAI